MRSPSVNSKNDPLQRKTHALGSGQRQANTGPRLKTAFGHEIDRKPLMRSGIGKPGGQLDGLYPIAGRRHSGCSR